MRSDVIGVDAASCSNSRSLGTSSVANRLMPVMVPPGRLRLATRPSSTGSEPLWKTIGIVVVADVSRPQQQQRVDRGAPPPRGDARNRPAIRGQLMISTLCPAELDRNIFGPRHSRLRFQSSAKPADTKCAEAPADLGSEKPDHRHGRLLRAGRKRPPRRRAAEQRNEFPPPRSITSSAKREQLSAA